MYKGISAWRVPVRENSVPVRVGGVELDLNCFLIRLDVVPLAVRVPALRDDLNQYLSAWNLGNLHSAVFVRLEIELGQLIAVKQTAGRVEADIHGGIADGFIVGGGNLNLQLCRCRVCRLPILLLLRGGFVRRCRLIGRSGFVLRKGRSGGEQDECHSGSRTARQRQSSQIIPQIHVVLLYSNRRKSSSPRCFRSGDFARQRGRSSVFFTSI